VAVAQRDGDEVGRTERARIVQEVLLLARGVEDQVDVPVAVHVAVESSEVGPATRAKRLEAREREYPTGPRDRRDGPVVVPDDAAGEIEALPLLTDARPDEVGAAIVVEVDRRGGEVVRDREALLRNLPERPVTRGCRHVDVRARAGVHEPGQIG